MRIGRVRKYGGKTIATTHRLRLTARLEAEGLHEFAYSADMSKRYGYAHIWGSGELVLWLMFNPGTGESENRRRNTFERCKSWSKAWGYGGLLIGNLFATRTKSAKLLAASDQRADPLNEQAVRYLQAKAEETIVAWGGKAKRLSFAGEIVNAKCLGVTADGSPRHPLYVRRQSVRTPWPVVTNHAPVA